MARWTSSAKWAEGPAPDGQRAMPLALRLSEGLGISEFTALSWPSDADLHSARTGQANILPTS